MIGRGIVSEFDLTGSNTELGGCNSCFASMPRKIVTWQRKSISIECLLPFFFLLPPPSLSFCIPFSLEKRKPISPHNYFYEHVAIKKERFNREPTQTYVYPHTKFTSYINFLTHHEPSAATITLPVTGQPKKSNIEPPFSYDTVQSFENECFLN